MHSNPLLHNSAHNIALPPESKCGWVWKGISGTPRTEKIVMLIGFSTFAGSLQDWVRVLGCGLGLGLAGSGCNPSNPTGNPAPHRHPLPG